MFSQRRLEILYVANSGILISSKDKKVLIDGIHATNVPPYFPVPPRYIEKMLAEQDPFDDISILFFTHHHTDHFDPDLTNDMLKQNQHMQLIGTSSVLNMLSTCENYDEAYASQIRPISLPRHKSLQMSLRSIPFEVTSLFHDGETYQSVENFSYLIEIKNKLILHVGDAQPSASNFQSSDMTGKKVDVLIVPFPFIGLASGRQIINSMDPQHVIVTHLPDKNQDEGNYLFNTYNVYKKYSSKLPKTTFFTKPGQKISI